MCKFKIHLLLLAVSFNFLQIVKGKCFLNYPENIESVPRYEKHIGKYRLPIPYNGKGIQLQDDETINSFCDTQFRKFYYKEYKYDHRRSSQLSEVLVENKVHIIITCTNDKLYYDGHFVVTNTFECEKIKWSIYATNEPNSWCERNLNSSTFLLATKSMANPYILAGICYNFEQLSLQTVNYNLSYTTANNMKLLKSNQGSHYTLTDDLLSFMTTKTSELSTEILQEQLTELEKTNSWLHLANYEVSSIVQGDSHGKYLKEYENLLNIIWWHNLRLGNWKYFMKTLDNYAHNNSFELYTGISDVVRFPTEQKCEQNNLFEVKIGFKNETIPAYIWTYLKSNDNLNRDFVIVGYNSPYAEFFSLKNVIFCPDICSEIPWLSEITSYFRYSFAGIMFCCSTDFIRQTNHLNGFPMDVLLSGYSKDNTEIEVTTEIESETKNLLNWDRETTTYIPNDSPTEQRDYDYDHDGNIIRFYN